MGEISTKTCNCDLIGCFCRAKVVIVRDWIILADDDSIAFDFRTPSSIFYVTFTCFFSLCNNFTILSLMCLAGSGDILYLLTELTMFTD